MAAALTEMHARGLIEVRSAGSEPADQVNPMAVAAMAELEIDITARQPKLLSDSSVQESDVVITMGCGDACPVYPGKRYLDWELADPAGQDLDTVRGIRNEINLRVIDLVQSLLSDGQEWERPAALQPD
jgi:protein-tyrosine-phosphatase